MTIRKKTIWRVPVFCIFGSLLSYYLTVYVGGHFFTASTVASDGSIILSADPLRSAIWSTGLFAAILVVGGMWFHRSMTRKEIALSAGIITAVYFSIVLMQLYLPNFPASAGFTLAPFQNWTGILASILQKLTGNFSFSVIGGTLAPLLFIPFGKKAYSE